MFELLKRDGRQAAFNVFALIGIIGSALAVVNWIFSVIKLPLAVTVASILSAYQMVFHPMMEWLTGWLPFTTPTWFSDVMVLWLAIGSAVTATTITFVNHASKADEEYWATDEPELQKFELIIRKWWARPIVILLSLFAWPVFLIYFLSKPMIVESKHKKYYFLYSLSEYNEKSANYNRFNKLKANLGIVFAIRLLVMIIFVVMTVLINVAATGT